MVVNWNKLKRLANAHPHIVPQQFFDQLDQKNVAPRCSTRLKIGMFNCI